MSERDKAFAAWKVANPQYHFVTGRDWMAWCAAWDMQQAQIDRLMLEFCPDEMSQEQLDEWAKHQRVSVSSNPTKALIHTVKPADTTLYTLQQTDRGSNFMRRFVARRATEALQQCEQALRAVGYVKIEQSPPRGELYSNRYVHPNVAEHFVLEGWHGTTDRDGINYGPVFTILYAGTYAPKISTHTPLHEIDPNVKAGEYTTELSNLGEAISAYFRSTIETK